MGWTGWPIRLDDLLPRSTRMGKGPPEGQEGPAHCSTIAARGTCYGSWGGEVLTNPGGGRGLEEQGPAPSVFTKTGGKAGQTVPLQAGAPRPRHCALYRACQPASRKRAPLCQQLLLLRASLMASARSSTHPRKTHRGRTGTEHLASPASGETEW